MYVTVIGSDKFVERALSTTISQPNNQVNYSHGELSFRAVFTICLPFLHLWSAQQSCTECKVWNEQTRTIGKRSGLFSTIVGSLSLLSGRQKFAVALLAVATLFINSLDIVAISLLSLVGSLALGGAGTENLPWLDGLEQNTLVISVLLIAAGVFAIKTVAGIFLTRVRQNFLATLEIHFSKIIAANIFSVGLSKVKKYSRAHLEWTILRSTSVAFGIVIGQSLGFFAEASLTIFIKCFNN
mgnify:CR=1 FL=1